MRFVNNNNKMLYILYIKNCIYEIKYNEKYIGERRSF